MKKFKLPNRYGRDAFIKVTEEGRYFFCCPKALYWSKSFNADLSNLFSVDPEGGPFVSIGDNLKFYSAELPDVSITEIIPEDPSENNPDSGYELIVK